MFKRLRRSVAYAACCAVGVALTSCSGTVEDSLDSVLPSSEPAYKSSKSTPPLEVPPDLSSATINDSMVVPSVSNGQATYSAYVNGDSGTTATSHSGVLPRVDGVSVERSGDQRWLVVDAPPAAVWPKVREFWVRQGFLIEMEDPAIGIIETDWAEKRTSFKGGVIRNFLSNLSSTLYGPAIRDKYRTRLEYGAHSGSTEIYISHRGAEEVSTGKVSRGLDDTGHEETRVWQPRPSDPELEAEMLNRLVLTFGLDRQQAGALVAQAEARPERARIVRDGDGVTALALEDNFARAWRRTGLALDRVGFTVEDRDRSKGLFYVRYADPSRDDGKEGFFSKIAFWSSDEPSPAVEYLISLVGRSSSTEVVVLNTEGQRENSETANRILSLLHDQLK